MSEFHVDMRDIRFNLFDFLDLGALTRFERFGEFDAELFGDIVDAAEDQSRKLLHPLNEQGDRVGLVFENGRVRLPEGWKAAYKAYSEAGWNGLPIAQEHGGQGLPVTVNTAVQDLFTAANVSFLFTPGLTMGALGLICEFGTTDQKALYVQKMLEGVWSGTMCLTEPNAGTAVPDLKTTAQPIDGRPGFYKIRGQKIFISAGDQDLTENIVHMVLAKVAGDSDITLFIVPRMRVGADGSLKYNDVATIAIEEKLGIHASPTCQLAFGEDNDCEGWLIGERGRGLQCMFKMMNEARIAVGVQGVGLANAAYQLSVAYARERIQGTHIRDSRKADAPRVAIIEHPDVRRNLMYMKSVAEGARAMTYYASYCHDRSTVADHETDQKHWQHQLEILVPLVKAWSSDEAFRAAELGVQVHGGYGYIREYAIEQVLRDAKIASLYEGTNGVQALDLLGRKVARGGGVMMMAMLNEINKTLNGPAKDGAFSREIAAVAKARDAVAQVAMGFGQRMMKGDIEYSALHATPFLQMFGDTVVAWLLIKQAIVAKKLYDTRMQKAEVVELTEELGRVLEDDAEARFLHGKMNTAQFFVHQVMPRVHANLMSIQSEDRSALTVVL
ncbi:MAG: acyl-CoA dehydrogenase [Deltaproteobacteria bacterium]|nr:acyl-CoA dehydrogenase [Deltaproteobacteria bacterium]MCB9788145.1 acyl-CoA dehydrogenase [Deltaproteobacteria bacterium]